MKENGERGKGLVVWGYENIFNLGLKYFEFSRINISDIFFNFRIIKKFLSSKVDHHA